MIEWTSERHELLGYIQVRDELVAEMYGRAIDLLCSPPETRRRSWASLIGHALREFANRLPDSLDDVEGVKDIKRESPDARVKAVAIAYKEHEDVLGDAIDFTDAAPDEIVTVRRSLVFAAAGCVISMESARRNGERKAAAVVLGRLDLDDPIVKQWKEATEYCVRLAHIDLGQEFTIADLEKLEANVALMESILLTRFRNFFDTNAEILAIVDEANEEVSP